MFPDVQSDFQMIVAGGVRIREMAVMRKRADPMLQVLENRSHCFEKPAEALR